MIKKMLTLLFLIGIFVEVIFTFQKKDDSHFSLKSLIQNTSIEACQKNTIGKVYPVTQQEYVQLCNVLAMEYGLPKVSVPEKARVVQTIINRMNDNYEFPGQNTIHEVISAENQFDGYYLLTLLDNADSYTYGYEFIPEVDDSIKKAVNYCLDGKCRHETALYFWGTGDENYFYDDYASWCADYYAYKNQIMS